MDDKTSADKKKLILETAMKLFSAKPYHLTSMREIAESCEMSKGGLYMYFKSKEDLLLSIFKYHMDQLYLHHIELENQPGLSEKERFIQQIEGALNHFIGFQEIILYAMYENAILPNAEIKSLAGTIKLETSKWLNKKFELIYGPLIRPYLREVSLLFEGMIFRFIELVLINKYPLELRTLVLFIMKQIDLIITQMLHELPPPILQKEIRGLCEDGLQHKSDVMHPFTLIKLLREKLNGISLGEEDRQNAMQSLDIILSELKDSQPRKIVILGMINNLKNIKELGGLDSLFKQLKDQL